MVCRYCAAVVLAGFLFAAPALAQADLHGRVTEAGTGEGLPGVTIQVEGTYSGTVTNSEGYFRLRPDTLPAVLVVRHIGYRSQRLTVAAAAPGGLSVVLEPATHVLGELVVTDEDPAVGIMREVIRRKQAWRATLETYRATAYNRFTVSNDTGIVIITETLTDVFWKRGEGTREVLKARRQSANVEVDDELPSQPYVLNLYDDEVEVGGFRMIGVTHPDALDVYDFRLEGRRVLDEQTVYDIAVRPRRATTSGFVGRIAVLDSAYALLEVDLRPGAAFLFPPPIMDYDVGLRQQFSNFGRAYWLPVDFQRATDLEIRFGVLFELPDIHVAQTSRLTQYAPNVPVPDSLFAGDAYLVVDSVALRANELPEPLVVPLSAPERVAYAGIDSTLTFGKAFKPRGLMARMVDLDDPDGEGSGSSLRVGPRVWRNRVEGWHAGVQAGRRFGRLEVEALAGYATDAEAWDYGGGLRLDVGPARRVTLEGGYHRGIVPRVAGRTDQAETGSIVDQLAGGDRFDYYRNERFYGGASYRPPETTITAALRLNAERHRSFFLSLGAGSEVGADGGMGAGDVGGVAGKRGNPAIPEGRLRSLEARFSVGDAVFPGIIGGNRLEVAVEHSAPGLLGSDFGFTRVHAVADLRVQTLLRRRFLPAALDVRLVAGAARGTLPPQRVGAVAGSVDLGRGVGFATYGSLRTLRDRVYEGDRYAGVFWEHSFRTLPFELVGFRWAARKGYNVLVHGGHARSWLTADLSRQVGRAGAVPGGFHHEAGVSLSGLFTLFRLDATWRLDAPGFALGVSMARLF